MSLLIAGVLGDMTIKGPFQPKLVYDSVLHKLLDNFSGSLQIVPAFLFQISIFKVQVVCGDEAYIVRIVCSF